MRFYHLCNGSRANYYERFRALIMLNYPRLMKTRCFLILALHKDYPITATLIANP